MKKNVLRVISLILVVGMLASLSACTQTILVRFVDKDGNDLNLSGIGSVVADNGNGTADTTAAPSADTTAAPSADTTAAPSADTTAAPSGDSTATTAAPAADTTAAPAATGTSMPSTKDEIMNFYKAAATRVANGEAAYTKKEYQAVGDLNITGIGVADNAIKSVIGGIMTEESAAEEQICAKGSDEAKNRWSAKCTLTDYSFIKSATCEKVGSNYKITIVTNSDDTPHKSGSTIEKMSQSVLWWEDVEKELANQSNILKSYDGVHLMYNSVTFTAEITPDGKFVSMDMNANVDIIIGSAKILIATIKDKQAHLDNYVKFYNFTY